MDQHKKALNTIKINETIKALKKNNMHGYHIDSKETLFRVLLDLVPEKSQVAVGGSMTLFEAGVIDFLREKDYDFLDRYAPGLTPEAIGDLYRKSFFVDAYFTGTNALIANGALYNVDGNGNRVACMIYGPKKVIVITSFDKIVPDLQAAIQRKNDIAGPANAIRLNRKTPCAVTGVCSDCNSPERICSSYTLIKKQMDKNRIHVLILDEPLGY